METPIFKTEHISLLSNERSGKITLHFYDEQIDFLICEWFAFQKKIQKIDLQALLDSESADVEILHLLHCDKFLILDIYQVLELLELFEGTQAMIDLDRIIEQKIFKRGLVTN